MKIGVKHIASVLFVAAVVILFVLYLPDLTLEELKGFVRGFGVLAPVVFILICIIRPVFFFVPTFGLTIIAGTVFGPFYGTLYVAIGGAGSAIVGFALARLWGRGLVERIIKDRKKLLMLDEKMLEKGFTTILMLRVFNVPWDIVSYSAGLSRVRFKDFYLASLIMLLPISFVYTYFGSTVTEPGSPKFIISLSLIGLFVAVPLIIKRYKRVNARVG